MRNIREVIEALKTIESVAGDAQVQIRNPQPYRMEVYIGADDSMFTCDALNRLHALGFDVDEKEGGFYSEL